MSHIRRENNVSDFNEGDRVTYVPAHLIDEFAHRGYQTDGIQRGVVKSKNDFYIFVRYVSHGELQAAAQATNPKDLINDELSNAKL